MGRSAVGTAEGTVDSADSVTVEATDTAVTVGVEEAEDAVEGE